MRDWADEILGLDPLDVPARNSLPNAIEREFHAYLLDTQTLSSTLLFWQVWMSYTYSFSTPNTFMQENRTRYPTMFFDGNGYSPNPRIIRPM